MSTGVGDLVSHLEADNTDFVEGMEEAAKEVDQVTVVVHEQRASWSALAASAVPAIGQVTASIAGLVGTLATIRHQRELIAGVTGAFSNLGTVTMRWIGPVAKVAGYLVPQWKAVTTAVSVGALAWKAASSDTVQSIARHVAATEVAQSATEKLGEAFDRLGNVAQRPFVLIATGAVETAKALNPVSAETVATAKAFASGFVSGGVDLFTGAVSGLADELQRVADSGEAGLAWLHGDVKGYEATAEFIAQAEALRKLATESERALALQERRQESYRQLGAIQQGAQAAVESAAEIEKIHSITTLDALETQRAAYQQLAHEAVLSGKVTEDFLKRQAQLFGALAEQEAGIKSGKVMPEGQKEAEATLKSLNDEIARLTGSYDALADARMRDGGANEATLGEIRLKQELKKTIDSQKEAEKQARKELEEDTRRQIATWEKETDKIGALKDELDLLTGAATKADIERRKALEAGFTEAGADEIAALTEQLDAAQNKERLKSERSMRDQSFEFATKGSSAAFTTLFRAENRGGSAEERAAKAAEKTAQEMGKANANLGKLILATEKIGLDAMEIGGDA